MLGLLAGRLNKAIYFFIVCLILTVSHNLYAEDINLYIFTSDVCEPCKQLKEFILNDDTFAKNYSVSFIDINKYKTIAKDYKIKSVPTTVILKDNRELGRLIGYGPDYIEKLNKLQKK